VTGDELVAVAGSPEDLIEAVKTSRYSLKDVLIRFVVPERYLLLI
jgi:hypothetical protein